jgi:hypothetical protein
MFGGVGVALVLGVTKWRKGRRRGAGRKKEQRTKDRTNKEQRRRRTI